MPTSTAAELAPRLRALLERLNHDPEGALADVPNLYAEDVLFQDPIQTLRGCDAFIAMNRRLLARARRVEFELGDLAAGDGAIFLAWTFHFTPRIGPTLHAPGATHARVEDGRIVEHHDYWDLLGFVGGSIPGIAPIYRALVARLG